MKSYRSWQISNISTAENLIVKLASPDKRSGGSSIKQYDKVIEKYSNQLPLNQRLAAKQLDRVKDRAASVIIRAVKNRLRLNSRLINNIEIKDKDEALTT